VSSVNDFQPTGGIAIYFPTVADDIFESSARACQELVQLVKTVDHSQTRLYAITSGAIDGQSLAEAPLVGLSRIIASEHPEIWGGLIDNETEGIPMQVLKYVSADVVKVDEDGVARVACLRQLPRVRSKRINPNPAGTYLVSGGLGSLGLEVAKYLASKGARRLVLISRRVLPPRAEWNDDVTATILALEKQGVGIKTVAVDLTAGDAPQLLKKELSELPPVLGVVHAAGLVENQLVVYATPDAFNKVLAPKVSGALALHTLFPLGSLDFFVLFSSCGQLLGFPGQASYASGNGFLDALAAHRQQQGDNACAFQWTSWRGVGGMGDNEYVEAEVESRGITSITAEEAFQAWEDILGRNIATATVLRARTLEADEPLPHPILEVISKRKEKTMVKLTVEMDTKVGSSNPIPSGPERLPAIAAIIANCVCKVLEVDAADVDTKAALSDMGLDSLLTVSLRNELQRAVKVKVPPTLIWGHPTISHLVKWFDEQL
jgi:6-methylsalicylic acid synthase